MTHRHIDTSTHQHIDTSTHRRAQKEHTHARSLATLPLPRSVAASTPHATPRFGHLASPVFPPGSSESRHYGHLASHVSPTGSSESRR
eukprot:999810-Prorocentrum_minimum.AAC.1